MLALAGLLCAAESVAQFNQYVAPGSPGSAPEELEERLENGSANARWRFGRLRVDPQIFVRDVGYQSNVFGAADDEEQISDYRALVAAGLNGYLPIGRKGMFSAFLTPEYSWWRRTEELRELSLSAGAGFFGFFNRLTLSIDGRRIDQEGLLNLEVAAPAQVEEQRLSLAVDVELRRSLSAFVALRSSEFRHSGAAESFVDELDLRALDRDFDSLRAGLRLKLASGWSLDVGVEDTENDFLLDPGRRSNRGTNPFAELVFSGQRLSAQLSLSDTDLEFSEESPLRALGSETGAARLAWRSPQRVTTALYARRNIVFSAREADSLFVDSRYGVNVAREPGPRFTWLVFVEHGDIEFFGPPQERRDDELTAVGIDLTFALRETVSLVASVAESDYRSVRPELDRSSRNLGLRLSLRRNLFPF